MFQIKVSEVTKRLREEHEVILNELKKMKEFCWKLQMHAEEAFEFSAFTLEEYQTISNFIEFVKVFADGVHHDLEERILFPELNRPGVLTHCNPTNQMLYEHDLGRKFCIQMVEAIQASKMLEVLDGGNARYFKNEFLRACFGYIDLMTDHIFKENQILFNMAEELLDEEARGRVIEEMRAKPDLDLRILDIGPQ